MSRIQEFISRQRESYVEVIKRYAVTVIAVIVLSILGCLDSLDVVETESLEDVYNFLGFFVCCTFFAETVLKSKSREKVTKSKLSAAYIIAAAAAGLVTMAIHMIEDAESDFTEYYLITSIVFAVIILIGFAMRRLVKDSDLTFEKYAVKLIFSFTSLLTIVLVLNLGFLIILELIDNLLVDIKEWRILGTIEYLLMGTVYTPFMLICLNVDEEEDSKFSRGLVMYALTPLYTVALAIIYLYIFKLIITWDFPSNSVFGICAGLFAIGVCIWTAAYSYVRAELDAGSYSEYVPDDKAASPEGNVTPAGMVPSESEASELTTKWGGLGPVSTEQPFIDQTVLDKLKTPIREQKTVSHARSSKTFYDKLIIYMKYIYAPLILLELYCLGVRIHDYGLTSDRLMGVWFMIAQVIYIAWEPIYNLVLKLRGKKEKIKLHDRYEDYLYAVLVMFFLAVLCPFTNILRLEYISQKARFEAEHDLSNYRVLKYNMYGKRYLEDGDMLGPDYEITLKKDDGYGYSDDDHAYNHERKIYLSAGRSRYEGEISVAGASSMYMIDNYRYDDSISLEDAKQYSLDYEGGSVTVDLSALLDDLMQDEKYKNGKHATQAELPRTLTATDGTRLVVTYISCAYTKSGYEEINIKGYVLKP